MKIYTRSDNQAHDSLEYKLLHIITIEDRANEREVHIDYSRFPDVYSSVHSYDDFDALPPGTLSAILTEYSKHPPSLDQCLYPSALFAAMSGGYVDTRELGHPSASYPLLTNIQYIKQSANANIFDIYGYYFKIVKVDDDGIPVVKVAHDVSPVIKVESHYLEQKWPGILNALPIMESLGYTDEDILREIDKGFDKPLQPVSLASDISFE